MAQYWRGELSNMQAISALDLADVSAAFTGHGRATGPAVCQGMGTSFGVATGTVVFTADGALRTRDAGGFPILFLRESRPEDLPGMLAAVAVVTERGGHTSHAAVVARGLGRPAVTALDATIDHINDHVLSVTGGQLRIGDVVTIDGATGQIHRGGMSMDLADTALELRAWLSELLVNADSIEVRVNADSAEAAAHGLAAGAEGIGLCRVEHTFLGERQRLLERALMSAPGPDRIEAVQLIGTVLRDDLIELLHVMDGRPVAIRLLDPPRHEFLPDLVDLAFELGRGEREGQHRADQDRFYVARRLAERNPMLGLRGMRLAVAIPELAEAQLRAIVEATAILHRQGHDPRPQLLLPMVMCVEELHWARSLLAEVVSRPPGPQLRAPLPLGVMIETPRAAVLTSMLAKHADFLSIGTNDLTALVWGLSRDDAEHELLPTYQQLGLLERSPFRRLDLAGVGTLISDVVRAAKAANPHIQLGVCGEHVSDPEAVGFLMRVGIDYLSCSAPLVVQTRVAGAKARLAER